ncbi:MAG: AroM family protein [Candidatus Bathyarchaeia archaeon]
MHWRVSRLEAKKPLIMLEQLIKSFACWVKGGKIGVVVPEKEQAANAEKKWRKRGASVVVVWANPYGDVKALKSAAVILAEENVDLIILDCIGFTVKAWKVFRQLTCKPVLLPQTVLGCLLKSLS